MARYGTWRPLADDWDRQVRMARYDLILLHTMVGSLWGTDRYFRANGYRGAESHWGVGHDAETLQWQDTRFRAEANGAANDRALSIETADYGPGFDKWNLNDGSQVPAWTPAQVERLADLIAWCCAEHDIPCELIPDSRPHRRGIGYHRQGCDPWRVDGGEKWSSAYGKVCPGARRIAQIPDIVARARRILDLPAPAPVAPPAPATRKKDDMGVQNFIMAPTPGPGPSHQRLNCPVGRASTITARAWISLGVNGPRDGSARIWAQSDTAGIADKWLLVPFADGRSARPYWPLPDGTTTIDVQYDMPDGGVITLETEPK